MNINFFMKEAIDQAKIAYKNNEVPIGGVLVNNKTNKIICVSYNKMNQSNNAIKINIMFRNNINQFAINFINNALKHQI